MRYRITIRRDAPKRTELRGYVDMDLPELNALARAMEPFGLVIASPAPAEYDPFKNPITTWGD